SRAVALPQLRPDYRKCWYQYDRRRPFRRRRLQVRRPEAIWLFALLAHADLFELRKWLVGRPGALLRPCLDELIDLPAEEIHQVLADLPGAGDGVAHAGRVALDVVERTQDRFRHRGVAQTGRIALVIGHKSDDRLLVIHRPEVRIDLGLVLAEQSGR